MPQITNEQRMFICTIKKEKCKEDWGYFTFLKQFPKFMNNITKRQFDRVIKNMNLNKVDHRPIGSGRPSVHNSFQELIVDRLIENPSQKTIAKEFGLSQSTISRIAKKKKLKCFKRVRVQFLSEIHRRRRILLSQKLFNRFQLNDINGSWKNIWFSDECSVSLHQPFVAQNCRIYRAVEFKNCIPNDELVVEQDRKTPSLMILGAISWHGKSSLFFIDGSINQV